MPFYENGFHVAGIDAILSASGIAKVTLFEHGKSQDDLMPAAPELRHERWSAWFRCGAERGPGLTRWLLLASFDVSRDWFRSDDFRAYNSLSAASE